MTNPNTAAAATAGAAPDNVYAPQQAAPSYIVDQHQPPETGAITINSRIADFWSARPRLWFHQFEAIIGAQKAGDLQKYQLVIAKLGRDELGQISDILENPPEHNKYETLKVRLISAYEESESKQLHTLLTKVELGDQRPTQLLRKMRELGRNKIPEDTIKILWLDRLPQTVRAVVTVCDVPLDNVAAIADKIMETSRLSEVCTLNPVAISKQPMDRQFIKLHQEIAALNTKIIDLQITRQSNNRSRGNYQTRSRSRSRSRYFDNQNKYRRQTAQPGDKDFKCFYHYIYGDNAKKCGDQQCVKKALN